MSDYETGRIPMKSGIGEVEVRVHFWIESMGGAHGFFKDPVNDVDDILQTKDEYAAYV